MKTPTTASPSFLDEAKSMACVHCGLCLGSCPTYLETGNENLSPRGRIYLMRALDSGRASLNSDTVRHVDSCLGCRACEAACPSGVQYGELIEAARDHVEHHHHRSFADRFLRRVAIEKIFPFPSRLKAALLPARLARALGVAGILPTFAREALALTPRRMISRRLPPITAIPGGVKPKGRVGMVSGCVMPVMFGGTNIASAELLARAGWEVVTPAGQVCCGALYAHSGQLELARACARKNIDTFEAHPIDAVIINAAGCGSTLKEYGHLLKDDPKYATRAVRFSTRVKDLVEWLRPGDYAVAESGRGKVTYHDACHLAHAQRITKEPRELVKAAAGEAYVELPEADVCCGSAGTYNLTQPELARRLQKRKIGNILRSGAQIVVTTNPGCLLQIEAGLRQAGARHVKAMHIADFLKQTPAGKPK